MVPFIFPNLYHRLSKLKETALTEESNYYDWMEDIWKYVEPSYSAFYTWAWQRVNGVVTDLGCGDGNAGKALNATYYYDYVQSFPECMFIDLNAPIQMLEGETFILSHVLEHLKNPKKTLQWLFEALNNGNRLLICVPDGSEMNNSAIPFNLFIPTNDGLAKHKHHVYAWTPADLYNTLIQTGYSDVEIGYADVCGFKTIFALAIK